MTEVDFPPYLGRESFVPFEANRIRTASLVAASTSFAYADAADLLHRFAYAIPSSRDPAGMYEPHGVPLLAERYGGEGIGIHGGGVRVGIAGDAQIKGIGRNPLAGRDSPLDYSHGGVSLFEAIQEMAWTRVVQNALPYGAVQCHAVIATGSPCWWVIDRWGRDLLKDRYGDDVHIPRGLIVRESAARPAHFERAMLYRPESPAMGGTSGDVNRVRQAMSMLEHLLPVPGRCAVGQTSTRTPLQAGLFEMARRFAEQSAAAKAKRLIHGNIGASNIALDGRWLDFGSITASPAWGELGGYGPFWDDSSSYASIFDMLCFNVKKYLANDGQEPLAPELLTNHFKATHAAALKMRFLAFTGVPHLLVRPSLDCDEAGALFRVMTTIARCGHRDPFEGHPTDESDFGTYHLGRILHALARRRLDPRAHDEFRQLLADALLRSRLEDAYEAWLLVLQGSSGWRRVGDSAMGRLMLIGSAKVARSMPVLYRPIMVEAAEGLVATHREPGELRAAATDWIDGVDDESSFLLEDPSGYRATVYKRGSQSVTYDAAADAFVDQAGRETRGALLDQAWAYWGVDFARSLQ